jgi:GNAT superfamily N-acetyltransferase
MNNLISYATTDAEIEACFPAFALLRPHLKQENFLAQVRRQEVQGYRIVTLHSEGKVQSVAGFRFAEFLVWGKILYIDDLSTLEEARGKGFASLMIDWLVQHAREAGCQSVQLDTGFSRHDAHRLYLKKGFHLHCQHLALDLLK